MLERQYLLGSLWGTRDQLADHGLMIDLAVTQVYQGVVSGAGDGGRYSGSVDLWATLDTGRANLWPNGLIVTHTEADWGRTVSGTGGLLPLNFDDTMPGEPDSFALSEFYLYQGLPSDLALVLGKVNWSAFADKSLLANNERTQFLYTGLNNNAILGAFTPYTSLGGGLYKTFNREWAAGVVITASNTSAGSPGFDDLASDELSYALDISWTPKFGDLPGSYNILFGYNSASLTSYNLDERQLIDEILGRIPVATEEGNRAASLTASQYLWVDTTAKRDDGQTDSISDPGIGKAKPPIMEAPIQPLSTSIMAIMCFGDVVFAVSGALTAAKYRMDVLGFVLIGTITGIGGGTLPLRGASSDPTVMKSL